MMKKKTETLSGESSDESTVQKLNKGSKKRKKSGRLCDVMKHFRLTTHEIGPDCKCSRYRCFQNIKESERNTIISEFNSMMSSRDEQNCYLSGLVSMYSIKNRRPRKKEDEAKFRNKAYSYKVRVKREVDEKSNCIEVPVCMRAFISLHGITGRRLQTIQESLKATGTSPKDMRGKYKHVHCAKSPATVAAVKDHISSFKGRQSHYSRKKSVVTYLPETLTIKKMYNMYKDLNLPGVSYEFYRLVFNNEFNIKFGYPRSDTCSICDKYNAEKTALLKNTNGATTLENDANILQQLKKKETEHEVHLRKAEVFYARKKEARKKSMKSEEFEAIAMDFQKNLAIPNITTNDVYYKRQLTFCTFNIHVLATAESYFYCYPENIAAKGSEEVISFLHHFIFTQLHTNVRDLVIFCDSCGGQNKNYNLFKFIHYVVISTQRLNSIRMVFPIRGHSYLECDRNMGLINQRTQAETVEDWLDEFRTARMKPSPFKIIEVDQSLIRQWNQFLGPSFKPKCPFAVRPIRELVCEAVHPQYISFRENYNGHFETAVVRTSGIVPTHAVGAQEFFLPERSYTDFLPISLEKWKDLQHLKQFCGNAAKRFFDSLVHNITSKVTKVKKANNGFSQKLTRRKTVDKNVKKKKN